MLLLCQLIDLIYDGWEMCCPQVERVAQGGQVLKLNLDFEVACREKVLALKSAVPICSVMPQTTDRMGPTPGLVVRPGEYNHKRPENRLAESA